MLSLRSFLVAASLLVLAAAQNIAFSSTPSVVQAGSSFNITWGGGDGTAVTLTLRRGNPQNLKTVSTIADGITGNYYVWSIPTTLENGNDYALQITQGQSDINYSGQFTIQGGSGSSSSSSTSTAAGNSTMSITSMASASGTGTAMTRNSTFSTATLTSSSSAHTSGQTSTTRTSSASATASTSAPSNDAPIRTGSFTALILGIVAAVMLH